MDTAFIGPDIDKLYCRPQKSLDLSSLPKFSFSNPDHVQSLSLQFRQKKFPIKTLNLSKNKIKTLSFFKTISYYLKNLEQLFLDDNELADLTELKHLVPYKTTLRHLSLLNNNLSAPVKSETVEFFIQLTFPSLELLNNRPVKKVSESPAPGQSFTKSVVPIYNKLSIVAKPLVDTTGDEGQGLEEIAKSCVNFVLEFNGALESLMFDQLISVYDDESELLLESDLGRVSKKGAKDIVGWWKRCSKVKHFEETFRVSMSVLLNTAASATVSMNISESFYSFKNDKIKEVERTLVIRADKANKNMKILTDMIDTTSVKIGQEEYLKRKLEKIKLSEEKELKRRAYFESVGKKYVSEFKVEESDVKRVVALYGEDYEGFKLNNIN